MGVYAGVNNVLRKVTQHRAGVNGAVRTVQWGFCGINGARRQVFGPLEDLAAIEIRVSDGTNYDIDSAGTTSNPVYFSSLSDANRYALVSIFNNSISVQCSITGKAVCLTPNVYAVFADGHEVLIDYLSVNSAKYGAAISWPVNYYVSVTSNTSGRVYGTQWTWCCGTNLQSSYFENSASGTVTLNTLNQFGISIGAGVTSGSGRQYTQMTFNQITIDGRTIPVRVISQLT